MDDSGHIDRIMYDSFKERLKFDALENHIILYSSQRGFEYNNHSHRIRPLNSVLWYRIDKIEFQDFIEYLDSEIETLLDSFEDEGYCSDHDSIGYCSDGYLVINLEDVPFIIKETIDLISYPTDVKSSYSVFAEAINHLYDMNKKFFSDLVKNQEPFI